MSDAEGRQPSELSRRDVLRLGAMAGVGASMAAFGSVVDVAADSARSDLNETTIAQLQARMAKGELSAVDILDFYLDRIRKLDHDGPRLNSVIEVNPEARSIAEAMDRERKAHGPRGPLHGIPVLLKDNIDTHDRMQTASGSLALVGTPPVKDSVVAARLRAAGAVILGKAGLSEWANFRGNASTSGWSGRGGLVHNPYALDRNPSGSSSGSAAATSANFTAVAIGSETDGSIVGPASSCGVVGIKPTVGLVSRDGVIPISHTQDTVGPHARTVADGAAVLGALTGIDYTPSLVAGALKGTRIGVCRQFMGTNLKGDAVFLAALDAMGRAGADLVDVTFPHIDELNSFAAEFTVLLFDFHKDLNAYLKNRVGIPVRTIDDVVAFNTAHAAEELRFFGQELMVAARDTDITDPATIKAYMDAVARDQVIGGSEGIDFILKDSKVQAIVCATDGPAWTTDLLNGDHFTGGNTTTPAAVVGYPIVTVPAGLTFGMPVGLQFMASANSEPTLIRLAYAFEQATHARRAPKFLSTLPLTGPPGDDERTGDDQQGQRSQARLQRV